MPSLPAGVCALAIALGATLAHAETDPDRLQYLSDGPALARIATAPRVLTVGPQGWIASVYLPGTQSETSVAASGSLVVLGFNDFRSPVNGSGVMTSADGGVTFTDRGQLPLGSGRALYGDPSVAVYEPAGASPVFYYASIFETAQERITIAVHRSTDGGATWAGPFEVAPASLSGHTADKEWIAVDPETGRLFVAWTDFSLSAQVKLAWSDTQGASWSTVRLLGGGTGVSVATDPVGADVYVAWFGGTGIACAHSADNGATWQPAITVTPTPFFPAVPPYGFDRSNSFPSIAVNPADHGVELVYPASQDGSPAGDFGDVYYMRSMNRGASFDAPRTLNARPGLDRAQVFPAVSAAPSGRIDAFWYDQSIGEGVSDLTDVFYTFSLDFGATWSAPVPVNAEPYAVESGNTFSAPNQGDYIDATCNASTSAAVAGFAAFVPFDPMGSGENGCVASIASPQQTTALRVRPSAIALTDMGCRDGSLVAGESGTLVLPLENIGRDAATGVSATLSSLTEGVRVIAPVATYAPILPGASAPPDAAYAIALDPTYPCGQDARFRLDVHSVGAADTYAEFTLRTGVEEARTPLLVETFDGVIAPLLPAGWSAVNQCAGLSGCTSNAWRTTTGSPLSPPNAATCPAVAGASFGRLFGPAVTIPAGATYVEVEFDASYTLQEDDARTARDAASFEYSVDGGQSRFATADAVEFDHRYTHYVVRTSGVLYGDRSGWSGSSGGYQHVRVRIPNLAGHTFQPRFSLSTDTGTSSPGVWIDNVVVSAVTFGCGPCVPTTDVRPPGGAGGTPPPVASGAPLRAWTERGAAGSVALAYSLDVPGSVSVRVFDVAGRCVWRVDRVLVDAGTHRESLTISRDVTAGVFVAEVRAAGRRAVVPLVLVR